MKTSDYNKIAVNLSPFLNALSHPARMQIVEQLASCRKCPAKQISERLPLCKSTVSQHLTKLKKVGIISCDPQGSCRDYHFNEEGFELMKIYFLDFIKQIEKSKDMIMNKS